MRLMIGFIKGRIHHLDRGKIVVLCNGVGYEVNLINDDLVKVKVDEEVEVYVYTHVREEEISLYGFLSREKKNLFSKFLSVSGVGPKLAMQILNTGGVEKIVGAVNKADVEFFVSVPGIGKKNAQRIILELQNKLGGVLEGELDLTPEGDEVMEALLGLGFGRKEAMEALKNVEKELSVEEKIKAALKNFSK